MAKILQGKPVADHLMAQTKEKTDALRSKGIEPVLALFRVGEREDDLAYERGALKKCETAGITPKSVVLPENTSQEELFLEFQKVNEDPSVHGILLFQPLPKHLSVAPLKEVFSPEKDVDGCTEGSLAGVFTGSGRGFSPCTAQAVMEMLSYYEIDPKGKNAVILGRSLVIGRPVSMLLMHQNATVTICHTKTIDTSKIASEAELLICAVGKMRSVGREYTNPGQIVIDVGIHWDEEQKKMCGDVDFDAVEPYVSAISPVPGGLGSVTSAVLCSHVAEAAEKK